MATVLNLPSLGSDTPREDKTPDENGAPGNSVRFGLISDVHQDIMHDAPERVGEFVEAMEEAKVDFICQLGDFCWPHPRNKLFLEQWNAFRGTQHHVLGNHDMDGGFSREQTVAFYGMPARHYSFDCKGVHFICLDGNDPGGKDAKGYPHFIDESQAKWLADDLAKVKYPSVLFSHQPLDHPV
ncbi:MAG: metallophosphoesterase, partial [Planctomycetota bacterium]|nr:metallophosphoesterase [Planctomycetota bacterium]